ncbi:basic phospholipase A2-like [Ascaphus truei]|uniref:basic phospholipase A2-like n=1 Tax=Ascaphus truei TaxID=8439 RepID=UPI003F5A9EC3
MATSLLAPALLLLIAVIVTHGGLVEFGQMILKVNGKPPVPSYTTYGCYCGIGGHGKPVDDIDWCCRVHDCCYEKMDRMGCKPRSKPYHFSYNNGILTCGSSNDKCASEVCECDRTVALCFKQHNKKYTIEHTFYPDFLCSKPTPKCK